MGKNEGLLKLLEIYSTTDDKVSQAFYQGLCEQAYNRIKELEEFMELLRFHRTEED